MNVASPVERLVRPEQKINRAAGFGTDLAIASALGAAVLAVSVYFAPRGFHLGFVDMGHDGYQLRQVLDLSEGAVIFRDTFDQYGPLTGYLNTAGFLALGRRLLAVKYFLAGWYAVIGGLLFMMARRWLSRSLAAFSVILWLGLAPFYQHGIMISAHVYVLLFQTVATLIALRAPHLAPGRYAIVGVLTGLSAVSKMSMGVAFLAAIILYLLLRVLVERGAWRPAAKAAVAVSLGFAIVIGIALALLWANGAFRDWYLQTIAFPRQFYLSYGQAPAGGGGLIARLTPRLVATFMAVQQQQALFWWIIRGVVVVTAAVQLVSRRADNDLLLMACITAVLWLGVFASLNFMHQWWTVSLGIAPLVVCGRIAMTRLVSGDRVRSWSTVAVVLVIVGTGLIDRKNAALARTNTLTETMNEPPMFRGIRTDAATKRAFETLYQAIARYRSHHPGTKLVTIDASDGWWTGINESLPFLSFFEDNAHSQAAYWSLPILTTAIYARYTDALWNEIRADHPLIVEQHAGWYKPESISGYSVLAAAQNDGGNWYVYAHDDPDRAEHGEVSIYLGRDGRTESGFAERGEIPQLAMRLSSNVEAALRGRIGVPDESSEGTEIPGTFPLVLNDRALVNARNIDVYTWPADLRTASLDGAFEPIAETPVTRAEIVRDLRAGAWAVDGYAPGPYSYLLEFPEASMAGGAYLVLRGELQEGGFTVGLLQHGQWTNYVNVTQPAPVFEVVVQIQKSGRYSLVVANCIESGWWQTGWRYRLRRALHLAKTVGPNRFGVTAAGWIH